MYCDNSADLNQRREPVRDVPLELREPGQLYIERRNSKANCELSTEMIKDIPKPISLGLMMTPSKRVSIPDLLNHIPQAPQREHAVAVSETGLDSHFDLCRTQVDHLRTASDTDTAENTLVRAPALVPRCEPSSLEPRTPDDTMPSLGISTSAPKGRFSLDQSVRRHAIVGDYNDNDHRNTVWPGGFDQASTTGDHEILIKLKDPSTTRVIHPATRDSLRTENRPIRLPDVGRCSHWGTPVTSRGNNPYGAAGTLKCNLCRSMRKKVGQIFAVCVDNVIV